MRVKYKMGNYRSKLRNLGFPEVACNSLKNKHPDDKFAAKNIKKARKGEVVDRNQLISESKKRDSTVMKDLMCRTFAHRRHDVVSLQMSISDIKDRWPALFDVSQVSNRNCCNRVVNTYCGLKTCMFHSNTLTGTSLVRPVI